MKLLTVKEFCKEADLCRETVRRWIKMGRLEGVTRDHMGIYLIPESNLKLGYMKPGRRKQFPFSSVDEARKNFDRSLSSSNRYIPFSYNELEDLLDEGLTYQEIAELAGVSRQRVEQICKRYFAPFREIGWERRKILNEKTWEENAKAHIEEIEKLSLLKREAEKAGLEVSPVQTLNNPSYCHTNLIRVDDKLCGVYHSSIPSKVAKRCYRTYYRFNMAWSTLKQIEFVVVMIGENAEMVFIIPSEVMLNLRSTSRKYKGKSIRARRYKTWYVPGEKREPYNNQMPDLDWWKYEGAWELLKRD
jgi:hypothetical protein